MKTLEKIANKMLAMTTSGHTNIVNPAMGTQAVSRNGPSLLIKSCNRRNQPLNNRYGLFAIAIAV